MTKKSHKNFSKTLTYSRHLLKFGSIGFKAMSEGTITKEHIFSIERSLQQKLKILTHNSKNTKIWCLLYTNKVVTKLGLESRMGKGKGSVYTESVFIKPGCIIYEFKNITLQNSLELLNFVKKQFFLDLALVRVKIERET
nr:ribosomal protein L16 [Synarthrophyton patena]